MAPFIVDTSNLICYKYTVTLKQRESILDPGAVPGDSTISTFAECVYDGVEIGSTGVVVKWSYRDVSAVPRTNFLNANANRAPEMALAA